MAAAPAPRPPIRVLIADDHAVVREGLKSILEAPDIVVVGETEDGLQTLEAAALLLPDVVLLDVRMPGGGGLETLRALRRAHPQIAVLMLSFYSEDVFAVPFLREGAHGYVSKVDAADWLLDAIRQVNGGGRYITEAIADRLVRDLERRRPGEPHERLTAQELLVLSLLAGGRSTDQIARELFLSKRTVHRCCGRILAKTGLPNASSAIQYALDRDIDCSAA